MNQQVGKIVFDSADRNGQLVIKRQGEAEKYAVALHKITKAKTLKQAVKLAKEGLSEH